MSKRLDQESLILCDHGLFSFFDRMKFQYVYDHFHILFNNVFGRKKKLLDTKDVVKRSKMRTCQRGTFYFEDSTQTLLIYSLLCMDLNLNAMKSAQKRKSTLIDRIE